VSEDEVRRDLVIGAAYGYTEAQLSPFLTSLLATGYSGRTALIVTSRQVREFSASPTFAGVDLVEVHSLRPRLKSIYQARWTALFWLPFEFTVWAAVRILGLLGRRTTSLRRAIVRRCYKPAVARYFEVQDYLGRNAFDRVLMSDVRDVVFQENPSSLMTEPGLAVSIELDRYTIGTEYWNAKWIKVLYGPETLDQLHDRPVSCSGVSWADGESVSRYLELMTDEMLATGFGGVWLQGCDQGHHNYLLWTGRLGDSRPQASLGSPIATLNMADPAELNVDDAGLLRNPDGSLVGIVHMYDRIDGLDSRLAVLKSA